MKVLIGSRAIKHWFPDFPRNPNDIDYAVNTEQQRDGNIEYLFNPVLVDYVNSNTEIHGSIGEYLVADPETLLTLKASHLFWDIKWEKHLFDACFLVKKGYEINLDLFMKLFKMWETIHGKRKTSDLTLDADKFFDNVINGKSGLDHDHIHTLIKKVPTYNKILKDGSEVEPDVNKFIKLPYEDKLSVVEEEVMVMAYERFRKIGYRHAFTIMLKKFIINHSPIWQAPFIIQNYLQLEKPTFNYYKQIEHGTEIEL